jgi:hypothetical protein
MKKRAVTIGLIVTLLVSLVQASQFDNLVQNPSFESFSQIIDGIFACFFSNLTSCCRDLSNSTH